MQFLSNAVVGRLTNNFAVIISCSEKLFFSSAGCKSRSLQGRGARTEWFVD
jgi:hypothetical protein